MSTDFSIVTIVKRRTQQLSNLISSIERSTLLPKEMVIVWMAPPSDESLLSSENFPIVHRFAASDELPIPKARNRGFDTCKTDKFIYLDVDCICPESLLEDLVRSLAIGKVVTANVCQLDKKAEDISESYVQQLALPQATAAEKVPFVQFDTNIFGITRKDYERVGGFDLDYHGFGIGDLDFAARCSQAGLYLVNTGRHVFKQFHAHYNPPVNHLCDIVSNAEVFKQKWGAYPSCDLFARFAELGLINADYEESGMRVVRLVTDEELATYLVKEPDSVASEGTSAPAGTLTRTGSLKQTA